MKTILNWKIRWLDDKSGCWYYAKVPILNWEYVIDVGGRYDYENGEFIEYFEYEPGIFYSKIDDDCSPITKKECYKKLDSAKNACEKHLSDTAEKFNKWINKK